VLARRKLIGMQSRVFRAVLLVWVWLGSIALAEPITHTASGMAFPENVAGFERTRVEDYESKHPGLGFSYSYRAGTGVFATVYVYTAGSSAVPSDINHPALRKLREQTIREIVEFARSRGETVKQAIQSTVNVRTSRGDVPVLFDGFTVDAPKTGPRSTYAWLWTSRGHFLKVRVTRLGESEPDQRQVISFVEAMVQLAAE
jgi:hypothetical protein